MSSLTRTSIPAALLLIVANLGWAQGFSPATNFPMIGVTRAQTLEINVTAVPPNPCFAQLGFQNSSGSPVGTTLPVTLQAGESASLAIKGTSLTGVKNDLVEVLPTVTVNPEEPSCVASAEVFTNSSGVTNVLVPGAVGYPPDPVFGELGVISTQSIRLNAVAYPPNPCAGTLSFVNSNGTAVGDTLPVSLSPGQATYLDLPGSAVIKAGERAEVRPIVIVNQGSSCVPSAEVFANSTELQAAFYPPNPCSQSATSCFSGSQ
jgi:hypothetical protein